MFAYLIIGIELAILYFVFWVVFIREPKPREIRAELWGHYQGVTKTSVVRTSVFNLFSPSRAALFLPSRVKMRLYRMAKLRSLEHRHQQKHRSHRKCLRVRTSTWRQLPVQADIQDDINRQLAEKFLLVLNRTLNKFSVKIPY